MIFGIDPGSVVSAFVVMDDGDIEEYGILENKIMADKISSIDRCSIEYGVIEEIASYGKAVGKDVFDTCRWSGKFERSFEMACIETHLIKRSTVKMYLCESVRGVKDSHIRQALIDIYGDSKEESIGNKKFPGPLYGVTKDVWQALAVCVTHDKIMANK